jgi:hypothetical protein
MRFVNPVPLSSRMRLAGLVAIVVLLFGPSGAAQSGSQVETVKAELRALLTELNAAVAAHDRAALERIYADDFLFVHALGAPIDKKGQIAEALAAPPGAALSMPPLDGLLVYGNTAILRRPVEGRFGTTIYVKTDGRWQILQLQGTPTPVTRPSAVVPQETLRGYAGRYQQDNSLLATISVEGDQFIFQVDGRQKLLMSAESATRFSLPAGAGQLTFTKAEDGRVSYEIQRGNGVVIKGTQVK